MKSKLNAIVKDVSLLNENLIKLMVKGDEFFQFEPGQFATIGLAIENKIIKRAYSVANKTPSNELELFISKVENGTLTKKIFNLKKNDKVWLSKRITGFFTLKHIHETNLLFIATGTGICPYISMLRTYKSLGTDRKVVLIHGVRYSGDFGYYEELSKTQHLRKNFFFFPTVSRPGKDWKGIKGRVQDVFELGSFKKIWDEISPKDTAVMLCGNPQMIEDLILRLEPLGFNKHTRNKKGNLHFEKYWSKPKANLAK